MFKTTDMPITTGDMKREAKAQLSGHWGKVLTLIIIPVLVAIALGIVGIGIGILFTDAESGGSSTSEGWSTVLNDIIGYFLATGVAFTMVDMITQEHYGINPFQDLFQVFTKFKFWDFLVLYVLKRIYTFLWTLLFIIPGIIKTYSYSQAELIYKDYHDQGKTVSANEAITLSRELMDGHKMDLFVLDLSFIGWYLLSIILLGIPLLYVYPYEQASKAVFYRAIMLDHVASERAGRQTL